MNKITLIGNLTKDPELRSTPSGVTVCSFTIAVNRKFAQDGEKITDFFNVKAWRKLGDICGRYLSKGKKIAVVGELQARLYDAKDGQQRLSLDVQADEVEFLSPKEEKPEAKPESKPQDDGFRTLSNEKLPWEK